MNSSELQFEAYKVKVESELAAYMQLYDKECAGNKGFENSTAFLEKYGESWRKTVASIGVNAIHESRLDRQLTQMIANQNKFSIGGLFGEIMLASVNWEAEQNRQ